MYISVHWLSSIATVDDAVGQKAFKLTHQDVKRNAVNDLRLNRRIQKQFHNHLLNAIYNPRPVLYKESGKTFQR